MSRVYKLHELIEMAKSGKQFEATYNGAKNFEKNSFTEKDICAFNYSVNAITADWTVTFKREPRVVWVPTYEDGSIKPNHFKTEKEANLYGKPIKFIEVIEVSSLFCPKCLADTCGCVARYLSDLEKQNEELKKKLEVAERALEIESSEPSDRSQEAAHYNRLDRKNEELREKNDQLEDKVYHSTRLVEQLRLENELLQQKLEVAKKALELVTNEQNKHWCTWQMLSEARIALKEIGE